MNFDFVGGAREKRRTAAGAEMPTGKVARLAVNGHGILRKYRERTEQGAVMLAAIEAMTEADSKWASCRDNADVAAQAAAGELFHAAFPKETGNILRSKSA